jgi:ribosome-associated translation inhibitor RaiA
MEGYRHDEIKIRINGFESDPEFAIFVKGQVDQIHFEEAPSDATTTASFTKYDTLVTGAIQISSIQGVFSAKARGEDGYQVVNQVFRQIRHQLNRWKRNRWRKEQGDKYEIPAIQ